MDPALNVPGTPLPIEGGTLSLADTGGRITLLTFGFTECPDICPTTLSDWHRVRTALGPDSSRVRFLFVSVDHRKDTPASAGSFARRFDPSFVGISPDSATLVRLLPFFQAEAAYSKAGTGAAPEVAHTTHSYVIDPRGRITLLLPFGTEPASIVHDVKRMLAAQPSLPK